VVGTGIVEGHLPTPAPGTAPLAVKTEGGRVVLEGPEVSIAFENGSIASYRVKGEERLAAPLVPHLWRVPTDNDEGGGPLSFASRWRQAGLDALVFTAREPRVERLTDNQVRVVVEGRLAGKAATLGLKTTYEVDGLGRIRVDAAFAAEGNLPPLPRVGFQLQLPGALDTVRWYGRGPHESYADRKTGAGLGRHEAKAADLHFPHVMAQENGNRTDTRWVAVVDAAGRGVRFQGEPTLDFTAHDYTDAALLAAKKSQAIERDGRVTLSLDLAQMGLGGDDSWSPRVHPEYQLTQPSYRFAFRIEPVE
jgi:beta-galactosidase